MKKSKKQYTVQLDSDFVEKIDAMAEKLDVSRSQLMRNLMVSGYEDAKLLDTFGLFSAFKLGEKAIRKIKEGLVSGKYSLDKKGDLKIND